MEEVFKLFRWIDFRELIRFKIVFSKFNIGVKVIIFLSNLFFFCIEVNLLLVVVFSVNLNIFGFGCCSCKGVYKKWFIGCFWLCFVIFVVMF